MKAPPSWTTADALRMTLLSTLANDTGAYGMHIVRLIFRYYICIRLLAHSSTHRKLYQQASTLRNN